MSFTLIDAGEARTLEADVDGERVTLAPAALEDALGWELKPEGLCREGACVPVRDFGDRVNADGVDLAAFAELMDRPLALDAAEGVASLGASARDRGVRLNTLEAPDFSLPDLSGRRHSLSEYRGKKVLLIAYASW